MGRANVVRPMRGGRVACDNPAPETTTRVRSHRPMSSLGKRSRGKPKAKGFKSAADWPKTDDIDGFTYELGPDPEDSRWAAEAFSQGDDGHATDEPPDSYYDALADEAAYRDRVERGIRD